MRSNENPPPPQEYQIHPSPPTGFTQDGFQCPRTCYSWKTPSFLSIDKYQQCCHFKWVLVKQNWFGMLINYFHYPGCLDFPLERGKHSLVWSRKKTKKRGSKFSLRWLWCHPGLLKLEGHHSDCLAVTGNHFNWKLLVHLNPDKILKKAELQIAFLPRYNPI